MYRERRPPPAVADAVSRMWRSREDGPKRIVPDGCIDLIAGAGQVFVAGPDTRAWFTDLPSGATLSGIRLLPGHAPRALGIASDELRDKRVALTDLWGRAGRQATCQLLDQRITLLDIVANNLGPAIAPVVDKALTNLNTGARTVEDAVATLDIGERQFRRLFAISVGYGPGTYLRIARLRRAIVHSRGSASLADVAAHAGYADQSHFSRDCRALTGLSPHKFLTQAAVVHSAEDTAT